MYRDQTATGEVLFDGMNILDLSTDLIELRRKVGMIFQKPTAFPMGVFDNRAGATFDIQADSVMQSTGSENLMTFNNAGTFKKSSGTRTTEIGVGAYGVVFNNTGTVQVETGMSYV